MNVGQRQAAADPSAFQLHLMEKVFSTTGFERHENRPMRLFVNKQQTWSISNTHRTSEMPVLLYCATVTFLHTSLPHKRNEGDDLTWHLYGCSLQDQDIYNHPILFPCHDVWISARDESWYAVACLSAWMCSNIGRCWQNIHTRTKKA